MTRRTVRAAGRRGRGHVRTARDEDPERGVHELDRGRRRPAGRGGRALGGLRHRHDLHLGGFYGDMSPFNVNYIAMMHGFAPVDLERPFSYLDLGCGNGVSLNIFAACHPAGQFHAATSVLPHDAARSIRHALDHLDAERRFNRRRPHFDAATASASARICGHVTPLTIQPIALCVTPNSRPSADCEAPPGMPPPDLAHRAGRQLPRRRQSRPDSSAARSPSATPHIQVIGIDARRPVAGVIRLLVLGQLPARAAPRAPAGAAATAGPRRSPPRARRRSATTWSAGRCPSAVALESSCSTTCALLIPGGR